MWRQPIPVGLESIFGTDHRANLLYRELLYRACNQDTVMTLDGKKHVKILRGQVLFGRNKFAQYICSSSATVDRTLIKLEKVYNQVSNQRTHDYTLVTINNYDEVVRLEQPSEQPVSNQRATSEQPVSTSKIDKIDKIERLNNTPLPPTGALSDFEKTFKEFSEMRKKIKKPMTPKAEELIRKRLEQLAPADESIQIQILEQSIVNSWQDVYALKRQDVKTHPQDNTSSPDQVRVGNHFFSKEKFKELRATGQIWDDNQGQMHYNPSQSST